MIIFLSSFSRIYAGIVINKFLPAPSGGSSEWVEFYNDSSDNIDLSDYFFDDDTNFNSDSGSSAKIALSGLLSGKIICYWDLPSYLNNNGDNPTLFKLDGSIIDTYSYTQTSPDKTYARIPDGGSWFANQEATKAAISCQSLAPSPTNTPTSTPTPEPTATKTPTPSPTITSTSTPKPTEKGTATPTSIPSETSMSSGQNREEGDILGAKDGLTASSSVIMERAASRKVFIITFLFIGIGCAVLSLAIVLRKQFFGS